MPFLLGLALPLLYCPIFVRPGSDTRLIAASVIIPLIFLTRRFKWTEAHQVGALFLAWCAVSLFWAVSLNDGLLRLWGFALAGAAFAIASTLTDRQATRFFMGLIAALAVNAIVAAVQFGGWDEAAFEAAGVKPIIKVAYWGAGLQINGNYLAEAGVMALALCLGLRRWWWGLAVAPAVLLSGSKGGLIAAAFLLCVFLWRRSRLLALAFPLLIVLGGAWHVNKIGANHPSFETRLPMYLNSLSATTFAGHGVGSYWAVYPTVHDAVMPSPSAVYSYEKRPRTAHNDAITVLVENGVVGFGLAVWFLILLAGRPATTDIQRAARFAVMSFIFLGVFNFPLYVPTTLLMAAACAGVLCRET